MTRESKVSGNLALAAKEEKEKVLKFLGGENPIESYKILEGHLTNDSFKKNSEAIFQRISLEQKNLLEHSNSNNSFIASCNKFAEENINSNFKKRAVKSLIAVPFYVGAALVTFFASPVAGIAISAGVTLLSAEAESREKRNVTAIGHCLEHIAEVGLKAVTDLYEDGKNNNNCLSSLTRDSKKKIEEILGINDPHNFGAKILRYASYVSGYVVSGVRSIVNLAVQTPVAAVATTVLGAFIPVMPLINTGVSYAAAKVRQKSFEKMGNKFEQVVEIMFNPSNYNPGDISSKNFEVLRENIKETIKTPHCEDKGTFISGDRKTNVKKLVSLPNWVANKFRNLIPAPLWAHTEDLAIEPKEDFLNYMQKERQKINANQKREKAIVSNDSELDLVSFGSASKIPNPLVKNPSNQSQFNSINSLSR